MDLTLAVLATLPLGLASFFSRPKRGTYAGIGFLAMLAPVLAKGVQSLIGHKQKKGEEKKAAAYAQQQAAAEEAAARQKFEASQDSPAAAVQRLKFNTKLAQILGKFGGREKTPGFITGAFDTARKRAEYQPGAAYVPPPTSGGGFWGAAGGIADALSYLDTSKLSKKPKLPNPVGLEGARIDPRTSAPSTPPLAVTQTNRTRFL
jgi:hypothetical protein